MTKILEATYSNGSRMLSEALDANLEGKKLKSVILETGHGEVDCIAKVTTIFRTRKPVSSFATSRRIMNLLEMNVYD